MLKASSDQSLSVSAAGRNFQLGIVYDAYKNLLFEDLNLLAKWSDYVPKKRPCPCISLDLKSSYTTSERMEAFRFGGHMKVGAAFGYLPLGSASTSYIQDMSSTLGQARMTLQYKQTIRYEELDTATIQKLSGNHEVLKSAMERGATHFVAGMTYGNQVLMDFKSTERHVKEHELLDIKLRGLLSLGQSYADKFNKDNKTMTNLDDIQCNIFCESKDIKKPASFKEAIEIYQNLPTTLQNVEAVESAYLLPLSLLDEDGKQFEQSHINEVAMIKLVYVRDDLYEQELQCDAMQERGINTSKIRDDIKKYTEKLKCTLSDTGVERWNEKLEKHNSSKFEIHTLQKQMRKDFVLIAARTCSRCKKEVSSESELAQHIKDHEARTCSRCKKEVSSESELAQHIKDHEAKACSMCTKHFSTQSELAEHMKDHEAKTCSMCTKHFSTQSELAEHMKDHEAKTCSMCTKHFSTQSELAEHMKDHEAKTCSMCTKHFSTQSELAEHMKDHEAKTCSMCTKHFSTQSELAEHMKDHEAKTCSMCTKHFSTQSELAEHMKDHEAKTCSMCTKHFSTQSELAEHMKDHEAKTCSMCTKHFSTQSELAEHMKDHEAKTCSMCTKHFSTQSELAEHMKDHEAKACSMCTKHFSTQSELAEHMKDHEDRTCSMCMTVFSTQSELAEHMNDHEDRTCSMCMMVFSTQSELAEHMNDHEDDARVPGFLDVGAAYEASGGAVVGSVLGPAGTVVGTAAGTVVRPGTGRTVGIIRRIYRHLKSSKKDKHRFVEGK